MNPGTFGHSNDAPDRLMEELASALWPGDWIELTPLLVSVEMNLRSSGPLLEAEWQLRRETYDRLEILVRQGIVERRGDHYRGIGAGLVVLRDRIAAEHCRTLLRAVDDVSAGEARITWV